MYGQQTTGAEALSQVGSRLVKIEYTGLLNPLSALETSAIVRRSTQAIVVPVSRMSVEMQRIVKMGGKVIGVTRQE
ncbi:MAG: photosystem I reaction center subunit XII [Synechococcaceae cyanobacterium SM2_3_1]|nr:photosystem I reaction center subunit XII [Synechococcaceae cyanobacterium SM2_3_1]